LQQAFDTFVGSIPFYGFAVLCIDHPVVQGMVAKLTDRRILTTLDGAPPAGHGRWTGPLIAAALGNVHEQYVWRFLRSQKIDLAGRKSWCVSHDPEFAAKAAEIVGLYLDPPEGALVVAVDEKPHIQALERAQGWLKLPNGKAVTGFSHAYKRHGTTTLFAALDVLEGKVIGQCMKHHRHQEFIRFLTIIDVRVPKKKTVHVIVDNYAAHKHPKVLEWIDKHPRFVFHFTPTSASWLNAVEGFFAKLTKKRLKRGVFRSLQELKDAIHHFLDDTNANPKPFTWTKDPNKIIAAVKRGHQALDSLH